MTRLGVLVLALGLARAAVAQEAAEDWIRPEDVPTKAEELQHEIEAARPTPGVEKTIEVLEPELDALEPELEALEAQAEAALATAAPLPEIDDLRRALIAMSAHLARWPEQLQREAARTAAALDRLHEAELLWSATLARPETAEAGEAVTRRVGAALERVTQSIPPLRQWRNRVLALADRVIERNAALGAVPVRLEAELKARKAAMLVPDREPVWGAGFAGRLRAELPRIPPALTSLPASTFRYLRRDPWPALVQLLLTAVFSFVFVKARASARRRAAGGEAPLLALERPYAAGTLLGVFASPWLHELAPRSFLMLESLIALVAVARIVTRTSVVTKRLVLSGLFVLLVLDRVALSVQALPATARVTLLVEVVFTLALALHVMRRGGLSGRPRWVRPGAMAAAGVLALALLALLGGWNDLSAMLGHGVVSWSLIAVYTWAAVLALDGLCTWLLAGSRWSRLAFSADGTLALRRAQRLVRALGITLWCFVCLGIVGLREPLLDGVGRVLTAGVAVGKFSLTVGGALGFVLTIVIAPVLARLVNLALEEGVYPRANLPRGVPYALSSLVRYAVYALAFLVALSATGVEITQLSILLGGLGVGIGLGLQDVVKNFAAGLTILFERRIRVGDALQTPEILGRVNEIGMRATVVRSFDGADVVVPNSLLVAGAVTNWTLFDGRRRIELPVPVAFGTEPARVVALLLEAAKGLQGILAHPAPEALFLGFGVNSLDFQLRVWIDDYDRSPTLRSELALDVQRRLGEAGIQVPFPQRDLNLASISPAALAALDGPRR